MRITLATGTYVSLCRALAVLSACAAATTPAQAGRVTRCIGQSASFTVRAEGTAPLLYQWRKDGASIYGATASTYTIGSVAESHAGGYDCLVSNMCGSAQSALVDLSVVVAPASSVAALRNLPDGSPAALDGAVVTRSFESYFYVEDPDRAAGIRVVPSGGEIPAEGSRPLICGTIRTIAGERALDYASVTDQDTGIAPEPLGMTCRSARELLPQGLLGRFWGRASVPEGALDTFTINDGTAAGAVQVKLHGVQLPSDGEYVVVTGVLGWNEQGPVIRVNKAGDLVRPAE